MQLIEWTQAKRGRAQALARARGVSQPTVSDWVLGNKPVPLEHCPFIEDFTDGEVTCEVLRPDKADYFALLREQAARRLDAASNVATAAVGD